MEINNTIAEQWKGRDLWRLLFPLIMEQILTITIGMADTVMVASVGEHAVSGVSLVDSINMLLVIAFGALATGGSVVVSQYIGRRNTKLARAAARQLMYTTAAVSLAVMLFTLALCGPILRLVYGRIEIDVMEAAKTYFILSAASYPFLAIYNAAASLYRSMGNSRISMLISLLVNILNIAGNAVLIFGFHLGVLGAGLATMASRATAAFVLTAMLVSDKYSPISLAGLFTVRLNGGVIHSILKVGVPSGVESSMFQIGKILVSRIFTTFGTATIAANAISGSISAFIFMPGGATGIGMMTIVGQCMGAKDFSGVRRYTKRLMRITRYMMLALSAAIVILMNPLLNIFNLSGEAKELAKVFLWISCVMSPVSWPLSFTLPNALRAAGDARFVMIIAAISMWAVRVSAAYLLAYPLGMGPSGVWIAMTADWCVRGAFYAWRWRRGCWESKNVLAEG
ncbi:MAG: MATE family efflux transporter [Treponema sp.]|nr:MATE family efflux transporter [Treponema sp.]